MIGGSKKDPLYNDVIKSGIYHFGYLSYLLLPFYHNAADLFLRPVFSEDSANSVGADVIESLACNTPVVSTTLINFPTVERKKLGEIPKNEANVVRCIYKVLDNPSHYKNCREIVRKYYDWKDIIRNTAKRYDELFQKYYD